MTFQKETMTQATLIASPVQIALVTYASMYTVVTGNALEEVLTMAEYIEKDEALAIIENKQREICPMGRYSRNSVYGSDRETFDDWQEILDEIDAIPAADVAPVRHGRWLTWEEQFPAHIPSKKSGLGVFCSTCHKHADNMYDYCPNCGAKMDGKERR